MTAVGGGGSATCVSCHGCCSLRRAFAFPFVLDVVGDLRCFGIDRFRIRGIGIKILNEVHVASHRAGTVGADPVEEHNRPCREPAIDGFVHDRLVVLDHSQAEPQEAALLFVVLGARRVGMQPQHGRIMLEPVRYERCGCEHPLQSDVGQPRFIVVVAAPDVRVYAREVDLFKK